MSLLVQHVFALDVDGKPTLAFEARNTQEARELCEEPWLRADLSSQKSNGIPLCDANSNLSIRRASAEEARLFGQAAGSAKPSDDLVLAYLVELDGKPTDILSLICQALPGGFRALQPIDRVNGLRLICTPETAQIAKTQTTKIVAKVANPLTVQPAA